MKTLFALSLEMTVNTARDWTFDVRSPPCTIRPAAFDYQKLLDRPIKFEPLSFAGAARVI